MNKVHVVSVAKELPPYYKDTKDILPLVEVWLAGQEDRFRRKVLKIFEGAGVDRRYGIMHPEEVFTATSFEEKNDIYIREVKKLGTTVLKKALQKNAVDSGILRLYYYGKLYRNYDPFSGCLHH